MDEEINLKEIISIDNIIYKSAATSKQQILDELTESLYLKKHVKNQQEFLSDVYLRETEGVTGIGNQVAIPHGKSKAVEKTSIAVGLLKNDVEWESLDGLPVRLVFLFAVSSEDSGNKHLYLLQQIAIKLAHDNFINNLINCKDKQQMYDLICE